MQITIVGAGNMGRAIAARALAGRHTVRIIDKNAGKVCQLAADLQGQAAGADVQAANDSALASADIVVLALKYPVTMEFAAQHASALAGKIVVDIANPADFTTFDPTTEPGTSAAEQLAGDVPTARVVKAFNTTFAGNLVAGQAGGQPLDVFIASDDAEAKKVVADLASSGGLHPIDVGPLRRARALEGFQILHMSVQSEMPNPWFTAIQLVG
jgi:predicted dinucleotide-binding enzyme